MWMYIKSALRLVAFVLILGIGIFLGADNSQTVNLELFGWRSPNASIFAWVLGALVVGFFIGLIVARLAQLGRVIGRQIRPQSTAVKNPSAD